MIWDERYAAEEYAYGTAPNRWLEEQVSRIAPEGRILSLGEGEGRNAVWLAEHGFTVDAVDGSAVGLAKAQRLAKSRGVAITTTVEELAHFQPKPRHYDAVILIYLHLPPAVRPAAHAAALAALKPGGVLIVEAFTPRQLAHSSGGPKQADMLYEPSLLRADLPTIDWESLAEVEVELAEGSFHSGRATVVRGVGRLAVDPSPRGCF